jgi:hypothetical protein
MLSDAEQRRLTEIESLLRTGDPVYVRRFEERWQARRRWRLRALVVLAVAVPMTYIGLGLGSFAAAVIGWSASCAAFGVWLAHRSPAGGPAGRSRAGGPDGPDDPA